MNETPWSIKWFETCGSTNAEALGLAAHGAPEWTVVVADSQTGGRGRLGRAWFSPPGVNLHVSVLLRPEVPAAVVPRLSLVAAVALAEAVEGCVPELQPELKWPNDLLVDGRKVAGALAELEMEAEGAYHVVLGIGINVNVRADDIPHELRHRATSLAVAAGRDVDRETLLLRLLDRLHAGVTRFVRDQGAVDTVAWQRRMRADRRVRVELPDLGPVVATALGLRPDGSLVVRTDAGGEMDIMAGDVLPVSWDAPGH